MHGYVRAPPRQTPAVTRPDCPMFRERSANSITTASACIQMCVSPPPASTPTPYLPGELSRTQTPGEGHDGQQHVSRLARHRGARGGRHSGAKNAAARQRRQAGQRPRLQRWEQQQEQPPYEMLRCVYSFGARKLSIMTRPLEMNNE